MIPLLLAILAAQEEAPRTESIRDPFFVVRDGEEGEVTPDDWGCKSIAAAEDLDRLKSAGDSGGISKAAQSGAITRIHAGTQILILKAGANVAPGLTTIRGGADLNRAVQSAVSSGPDVVLADIRIKEGPLKDQRFFIAHEALVRKVERRALTESVKKEIFGTYVPLLTKNQKIAKQIQAKTAEVKDPIGPTKLSIRKQFLLTDKELGLILDEGLKKRWPKTYRKPRESASK